MKKTLILFICLCVVFIKGEAQAPILGAYPVTNIAFAGGNTSVIPAAIPVNCTGLTASASAGFKGMMVADPVSGKITISNAHPAGNYLITVKALNGTNFSTVSFNLQVGNAKCSQGLMSGSANFITGYIPYAAYTGDFNNDGKQDMVTANYGANTISVRLGNGDGSFNINRNYAVGTGPQSIAIGDFNADGKPDMAVSNFSSGNVSVLIGDGIGGFITGASFSAGTFPYAISMGDFNNDGKQDLAITSIGNNTVSIRLGDGNGGFIENGTISVGNSPRSLVIADFNGDGIADIATANFSANNVSIRFGDGSGGFTGTGSVTVGSNPFSITIADFNNDGKMDFATANFNSSSISVRLGNGTGGFNALPDRTVGSNPRSVISADFNGDGKMDIATANVNSNGVSIRLGDGLGGFAGNIEIPTGNNSYFVSAADFNADGLTDIITANAGSSDVSVRFGSMNDIMLYGNNNLIEDEDNTPDIGDFTDFGTVNNNLSRSFEIQNNSSVNLTISNMLMSGNDSSMFTIGNIILPYTLVAGSSVAFTVTFIPTSPGLKTAELRIYNDHCTKGLYNFSIQGNGFSANAPTLGIYPASNIISAGGNISVTPSDMPGNATFISASTDNRFKGQLLADPVTGVVQIVNANPAGQYNVKVKLSGISTVTSSFQLTVGNPSCSQGLFNNNVLYAGESGMQSSCIADINGDGKQDLIVAGGSTNSLILFTGNGAGALIRIADVLTGNSPRAVVSGDFNGDGKPDLAIANSGSNNISIRLGDGLGNFSGGGSYATGLLPLSIVIGDFNGDGKPDLATANFNSNNVSVRLGDGLGGFISAANVPTGNGPRCIILADINMDGFTDLIIANQLSNSVSVRTGNGNGTFSAGIEISTGTGPFAVVAGDFNGDGKVDFTVANSGSNMLSVLLGDGTGNFAAGLDITVPNNPVALSVGDFNGDGKQDISVACSSANRISIFAGNGNGEFIKITDYSVTGNPIAIAVGDLNEDGRQDFITTYAGSSNITVTTGTENHISLAGSNISIISGDVTPDINDGTDFENVNNHLSHVFSIQNNSSVALTVSSISISGANASLFSLSNISLPAVVPAGGSADFSVGFTPTSTGIKTAVVSIQSNNCETPVYTFAVQGTGVALAPVLGNYSAVTLKEAGSITLVPSAAPINTSGITAATAPKFKGLLSVNPQTGIVRITNAYPAGTYLVKVKAIGISTAVSSFILTVTKAECSKGLFVNKQDIPVGGYPFSVAVGDFNADGIQDLVTANYSGNSASVRFGDGTGAFTSTTTIPVGTNPYAVVVGDFNADGIQDIVTANYNSHSVSVRLGNGSGGFTGTTNVPAGNFPTTVATGDFNDDGKPDLAIANGGSNLINIRLGDGAGNFSGNSSINVGISPYALAIGDFNNDGWQDILSASYNFDTVSVLTGDGGGNFNITARIGVGLNPYSIVTADFNGDGITDFATANFGGNSVSVRLGNGNGEFSGGGEYSVDAGPGSIRIGDFNGDGKTDFVTTNYSANNISVRYGNGLGSFSGNQNLAVGNNPSSIAVGDFNNDGKQDIAVSNFGSNSLSVRMNFENEINVFGGAVAIEAGDDSPSLQDLTDFGTGNNTTHIFTIKNSGTDILTISSIVINGTDASLFSIQGINFPATVAEGGVLNFAVTFNPVSYGIKTAKVNIYNDDCNEGLYDFAVKGTYECPQLIMDFSGLPPGVCHNNSPITLTGNLAPNGVFSGMGISDNGNGTAVFMPSAVVQGSTVIVHYSYISSVNGCPYETSKMVMVYESPVVDFNGLSSSYCTTTPALTLTGTPFGGIFSGPGISGDMFDPAAAGPGIHEVTYFYTDMNGCSNSKSYTTSVTVCPLFSALNLKLFLEGYYTDIQTMQTTLFNLDMSTDPTATDEITVNLWSVQGLSNSIPDYSINSILHTDGLAYMEFPPSIIGNDYYIAIQHRNHIETWSNQPINFTANTTYDFSSSPSQAYDDGVNVPMALVAGAVYALYAGDVNQDGTIDASDLADVDNDNSIFAFGYNVTDVSGDGASDASDQAYIDNNNVLFLFFARPY